MDTSKFSEYLQARQQNAEQIKRSIKLALEFEEFSKASSRDRSKTEIVHAFSKKLIERNEDLLENYYTLIRYGRFTGEDETAIAAIELIDGAEALENLYRKVGEKAGEAQRYRIFDGIDRNVLGLPNGEKTRLMQAAIERLEKSVDPTVCISILASGLRTLEGDDLSGERKKYLACNSFDEFLHKKGDDYMAELSQLCREHKLYFTQEITQEVLDFVDGQPLIRQGVREDHILYAVKIPHHAKEYIAEKDEQKKRYHYCHCPWVKESLKTGRSDMSTMFCNCSAAFERHYWEGVFDQPLIADVLETVLKGDLWCKFAIHLPQDIKI